MATESRIQGVIHGKLIELAVDPGLQDGQTVDVMLRTTSSTESGQGLRRAAGALGSDWQSEDDAILAEIQAHRLQSIGREPVQ